MTRALVLSQKSRYIAPPNPWVGCVLVKHGEIIAEGWTQEFGKDHAEIAALKAAQESAKDSTLYVTLEPCCIQGKTPPCTEAIIQAGVQKVVVGILDPDHRVSGRGVEALKKAGIEVEVGLLKEEIEESLKAYIHHRKTGLPFCILKAAISLDGKIAAKNGTSIWITGKQAREDVHRIRAESQAILVGTNTASEDMPTLTVRDISVDLPRQPLRVVIDAKGRLEPIGPLFDVSLAPTLIMTTEEAPQERIDQWKAKGCEVQKVPHNKACTGVDLKAVLTLLGQRGILQLLIEGGSCIYSSLIKEQLVDQIVLYMGACLLGAEGVSLFSRLNLESIDEAIRMHLHQMTRFGKDVRLDYTIEKVSVCSPE